MKSAMLKTTKHTSVLVSVWLSDVNVFVLCSAQLYVLLLLHTFLCPSIFMLMDSEFALIECQVSCAQLA